MTTYHLTDLASKFEVHHRVLLEQCHESDSKWKQRVIHDYSISSGFLVEQENLELSELKGQVQVLAAKWFAIIES